MRLEGVTAPTGGLRSRTVQRVRALGEDPLARHGYVIGLSSLATSVLGVVFWTVAARRYDAATVGIGAALVAVLGLLGNFAQLGLVNGFNRYLPVAGDRARWFLRTGGTTAATATRALLALRFVYAKCTTFEIHTVQRFNRCFGTVFHFDKSKSS